MRDVCQELHNKMATNHATQVITTKTTAKDYNQFDDQSGVKSIFRKFLGKVKRDQEAGIVVDDHSSFLIFVNILLSLALSGKRIVPHSDYCKY